MPKQLKILLISIISLSIVSMIIFEIYLNQIIKSKNGPKVVFKEVILVNKKNPVIENSSPRKYVAISTSLEMPKDFYMFYLPITCEAWRRLGFEPIVIMILTAKDEKFIDISSLIHIPSEDVNDSDENISFRVKLNPLQLKVIEYLKLLNVNIFYLKSLKHYEVVIGMMARIFIGYISPNYGIYMI